MFPYNFILLNSSIKIHVPNISNYRELLTKGVLFLPLTGKKFPWQIETKQQDFEVENFGKKTTLRLIKTLHQNFNLGTLAICAEEKG